jgi:hypothetical protein
MRKAVKVRRGQNGFSTSIPRARERHQKSLGTPTLKIEEFFADEARRGSNELSLGHDWSASHDPRASFSLFWIENTHELYALRLVDPGFGPGTVKPFGIYLPAVEEADTEQEVTLLGTIPSLDRLHETIERLGDQRDIDELVNALSR